MADCSPPEKCGPPCPPSPPDTGSPPMCGDCPPKEATRSEITLFEGCTIVAYTGCPSDGATANGGRRDALTLRARGSQAANRNSGDVLVQPVLNLQAAAAPRISGTEARSPALNVSNGNLYCAVPVVSSGSYAPPSAFTYNSRAAYQSIQNGAGVAGLYNQTLRVIDAETVVLTKGDGSSWRYSDYDSGSGYYLAPAGARNSLKSP